MQNQCFSFVDAMQSKVFSKSLLVLRPVHLGGQPLFRVYAAFWKKSNSAQLIRQFVDDVKNASRDFCGRSLSMSS